jgi:hypothetical protein
MSKRAWLAALLAGASVTTVSAQINECTDEPDLTLLPATVPQRRALLDVLHAAWKYEVPEAHLWALALDRSDADPNYYGRFALTEYMGLFAFQRTQWVETLANMGWPIQDARREDIWQSGVQAEAAAHLLKVGAPLRGVPPKR